MIRPRVLILSGYGINCEEETAFAFNSCGAESRIVHVNDLVAAPQQLAEAQIFVVPGGFSYGDDTGSGNALANKMRHHLWSELLEFVARDRLLLGICNGFQVLVNLGLLPGGPGPGQFGRRRAALIANCSTRYECRWVELVVPDSDSVFLRGVTDLHLPVAHGEGRFQAPADTVAELEDQRRVALRYARREDAGPLRPAAGAFPANPNGSLNDIAGITAADGRILGLMPHPERALRRCQLPDWPERAALSPGLDWSAPGPGRAIFANAVDYFS